MTSKTDVAGPVLDASAASDIIATRARSGLLFARRDRLGDPAAPVRVAATAPPAEDLDVDVPEIVEAVEDPIAACWTLYKLTGSSQERETLILHYSKLVSQVASRLSMRLPSSVEHADLTSYGMFGLIDAIDKFEPGRDIKFETYASARIRGSILDGLRAADWIPRSVRARTRALGGAINELEASLHREPSREEVAQHLQISVDEVRQIETHAATSGLMALDELLDAGDRVEHQMLGGTAQGARVDPAQQLESKEMRFLLGQAICRLPERDRLMIVLYHFEGLTLSEIGRVLGVTESRVSQMHTAAMRALKEKLVDSVG